MRTDTATLVPPRRIGALLRQARLGSGLGLEALAVRGLTVVDLDDIEHGRRLVDDELLRSLVELYGVEGVDLVPHRSRLVIDLDEGRVTIDESSLHTGELRGPDAVLARYLALVYQLREASLGSPIALRELDVDVLSSALDLDRDDVTRRLRTLVDDEDAVARDQRRIRRRLLLPLAGVVVASVGTGALLLVAEPTRVNEPGSARTDARDPAEGAVVFGGTVRTEIGPGGAVVENPDTKTELATPVVEDGAE